MTKEAPGPPGRPQHKNQTGNSGGLALAYLPTNQTQSISDTNQNPEAMAWAGPGQGERVSRSWTDGGTAYADHFTYTPLGLAGRTTNTANTPASSYFIRDPYGTPVAERNSDGTEYYYLFDGQGDVVGLEDPGTMVGSYDYCPTGNEADLSGGTQLTQAALNNPLRQGAVPYDDNTKDYFGLNGVIGEDYSGVGTQEAAYRFGDMAGGSPAIVPARMPDLGGGGEAAPTHGQATVCVTLTVGIIYYGSASVCQVFSVHGPAVGPNNGGTFSLSGGHIVGATASLTGGVGYRSAPTVSALGGPFGTAGLSAGEGLVVGADGSVGQGGVASGNVNVGAGVNISPLPVPAAEIHGGGGYTWAWSWGVAQCDDPSRRRLIEVSESTE